MHITDRMLSGFAWAATGLLAPLFAARWAGGQALIRLEVRSARDLAAQFHDSCNGGDYRRADPGSVTAARHIRKLLEIAHETEPVRVPPAGVAALHNAIVCGEGLVCQETDTGVALVRETLFNAKHDRSLRPIKRDGAGWYGLERPLARRRRLHGPHVLLRQIWDTNYGHWLIECLPRLAVVAEHFDLAQVKILVSQKARPMRRMTEQTLAAFGIKPEQIITMSRRPVEIDELIYPLPMTVHPWIKAPRVVSILEDLGAQLAAGAQGPKRIYVTRAGAGQRHLRNEVEVLRTLAPWGFTCVQPDRLSFTEQVRTFASAEIIVGNYGANLTNMIFAPRGVTLFALTSQEMVDDFFWDLTNLKSGRYHSLHGPATERDPDLNSDFRIDTMALYRRMEAVLGAPV